jgi:hypothetical protein
MLSRGVDDCAKVPTAPHENSSAPHMDI